MVGSDPSLEGDAVVLNTSDDDIAIADIYGKEHSLSTSYLGWLPQDHKVPCTSHFIVGIIQDRGPRRKENFHFFTTPLKSRLPDIGRRLFIVSSTVWWYPRTGHRGGYP